MGVPRATVLFVHLFLCSLGLALCGYAYYVEVSKAEDENFQALCDLSPEVSCSAVLTSQSVAHKKIIFSFRIINNCLSYKSLMGLMGMVS